MQKAIAIRHVHFEDLGIFDRTLAEAGFDISYRDAGRDPLTPAAIGDPDLLVVLGGPVHATDDDIYPFLKDELKVLEARLQADRPTLGICLGAQLMARALGARVYQGHSQEIGWGGLELTESGRKCSLHELLGIAMLHWHGDTFDLPLHATRLASTRAYRNQAFGWKQCGLALQFHAEILPEALEQWYIGHAAELDTAGIRLKTLREEGARRAPHAAAAGAAFFKQWLKDTGLGDAGANRGGPKDSGPGPEMAHV